VPAQYERRQVVCFHRSNASRIELVESMQKDQPIDPVDRLRKMINTKSDLG